MASGCAVGILDLPYPRPLIKGVLVRRRDRFIADIALGEPPTVQACHCVNSGRMEGFNSPGATVWVLPAEGKRRTFGTWELVQLAAGAVVCSTNTVRPNAIVGELLAQRRLRGLEDWAEMAAERSHPLPPAAVGPPGKKKPVRSRCDWWLRMPSGEQHWVEVKNCHIRYNDGFGYFPDSVSERATRHCRELAALASRPGHRATVVFTVQRDDVRRGVRPSDFHDPTFADAMREAARRGVRFRAFRVACDAWFGSRVMEEIPVDLEPYDLVAAGIEQQWEASRSTTGWIRTFGKDGHKLVANGAFAHNKKRKKRKRPQDIAPSPASPSSPSNEEQVARKSKYFCCSPDTKSLVSQAANTIDKKRPSTRQWTAAVFIPHARLD